MRFIKKEKTITENFTDIFVYVNNYKDLYNKQKQQILQVLISEQKGKCAYCNQSITKSNATIEHLLCQNHNELYDLNYHNLFAVCKGNDGIVEKSHCDKFRANRAKNDYFFPFILFKKCFTENWNNVNPFFDVEFNKKTNVLSGRILAKKANIDGYPPIESRINKAIDTLNLNSKILIDARIAKWEHVIMHKNKHGNSWEQLFDYYLNLNPITDFSEFVLLAIRKQVI